MTDISDVLPSFEVKRYANLLPSLEAQLITTADLLTLDTVEISKRTGLNIHDVRQLCQAVLEYLQSDLGISSSFDAQTTENNGPEGPDSMQLNLMKTGLELLDSWSMISTLNPAIDALLGGGIPTGYITEITGERHVPNSHFLPSISSFITFTNSPSSGSGKTQFLLTLLLAVQLPPPHGLSKDAIYITTES